MHEVLRGGMRPVGTDQAPDVGQLLLVAAVHAGEEAGESLAPDFPVALSEVMHDIRTEQGQDRASVTGVP